MKDNEFSAITFVEQGKLSEGYFFYKSAQDSDYGHILGMQHLTLAAAIAKMKEKGVDPIKNMRMNIAAYYGVDIYGKNC